MSVDQQFTAINDKLQLLLKLASGDMSDKDKKNFEKKINQYIKEIDKCIAFLSQ